MRILLIADLNSPLLLSLTERLSEKVQEQIYIYDFFKGKIIHEKQLAANFKPEPRNRNFLARLTTLLRILRGVILLVFKGRFDHVQILYVHPYYGLFAWLIKRKSERLVACLYGSDFYQVSSIKKTLQDRLFKTAKLISFTNERMLKDFNEAFPHYQRKLVICRFGLGMIDEIDRLIEQKAEVRELLDLPKEKIIIVCGHSSSLREQHLRIIENLLILPQDLKKKACLVLPMTYNANRGLINEITSSLIGSEIEFKILASYLTDVQLAALRLSSDIMINLPSSDQMTAAMLETLYAGGVVVTGSWLPYELLDAHGIDYFKIDDFDELPLRLEKTIIEFFRGNSIVDKAKNKKIISELFKWDQCINSWISILST